MSLIEKSESPTLSITMYQLRLPIHRTTISARVSKRTSSGLMGIPLRTPRMWLHLKDCRPIRGSSLTFSWSQQSPLYRLRPRPQDLRARLQVTLTSAKFPICERDEFYFGALLLLASHFYMYLVVISLCIPT